MKRTVLTIISILVPFFSGCSSDGDATHVYSGHNIPPKKVTVPNFPEFKSYPSPEISDDVSKDTLQGLWLMIGEAETDYGKSYTRSSFKLHQNEFGDLRVSGCTAPGSLPIGPENLSINSIRFTRVSNMELASKTGDYDHGSYNSWDFKAIKVDDIYARDLVSERLEIRSQNINENMTYGNCVRETITKFNDSDKIEYKIETQGTKIGSDALETRKIQFSFEAESKAITDVGINVFHSVTGERKSYLPVFESDKGDLLYDLNSTEHELTFNTVFQSDDEYFQSEISTNFYTE